MKEWIKVSLLLCTFGFFREMRPSEPFVTDFLSGEWRNITSEQVNREIYPLGTYSYLAQLVVIFLITDILRYKPIIIVSACVGIILWSLLLWTYTLNALRVVQVFYGTFMAAEVAYYTYMYARVDRDKYQQVTGHARAANLSGRFLAGVLAQFFISYNVMDVRELNYISFGSQIISLFWALLLPSVRTSIYFYSKDEAKEIEESGESYASERSGNGRISPTEAGRQSRSAGAILNATDLERTPTKTESNQNLTQPHLHAEKDKDRPRFSCNRASRLLWEHFITAYSDKNVLQWSVWWALAMAGFLQVQSYVQLLWQEIDPDQENFYNGGVEAALTLFGALSALAAGVMNIEIFERHDLWILTVCALLEGGFVLYSAFTNSVWMAYILYVLFGILYVFMITLTSSSVARRLKEDSFGLIFGINTLVALGIQTIMTLVVIDQGFRLDPKEQFMVFGSYFLVLALIYCITALITWLLRKRGSNVNTTS